MKRPVTSLCRRPGKKTACGAVCPRCGNNFRPQGRSAAGSQICRAKAARTRAQKQSRAGGRGLCADCAHGGAAGNGRCLVPGKHRTGRPPEQRAYPAQKQPRRGPGTVRRLRPWGTAGNGRCLVPGSDRPGCPPGQGGNGGHHVRGGVWEASHWAPPGQRARPGAKTAPGGAGGCLDAGYGCYLPRAIRVIWMHRVGSTARPRIMPS